jgi:hypothetical protein
MRGRKYLIGALVGVIGALTFSGVAAAGPIRQTLQTVYLPSKQDKKKFGGVSLHQHQEFAYDAFVTSVGPKRMDITLPRDAKFVPGNTPVCPLTQVAYKLEAAARAACPKSIVAQGSIEVNNGFLNGTFTFFRGESALHQDLIVHTVIEGNLLVVDYFGDISGGGRTLTIDNMSDTPGTVLTAIDTTFKRLRTGRSTFYVMARCRQREWPTTETITYYSGEALSTSWTQRCKRKAVNR